MVAPVPKFYGRSRGGCDSCVDRTGRVRKYRGDETGDHLPWGTFTRCLKEVVDGTSTVVSSGTSIFVLRVCRGFPEHQSRQILCTFLPVSNSQLLFCR